MRGYFFALVCLLIPLNVAFAILYVDELPPWEGGEAYEGGYSSPSTPPSDNKDDSEAHVPENSTCLHAKYFLLPAYGVTLDLSGTTIHSGDDISSQKGDCQSSWQRAQEDVFYVFETDIHARGTVQVVFNSSTRWDASLYILSGDCGSYTEMTCAAMRDYQQDRSLTFPVEPLHTYYIVVDGYGTADVGAFTLQVRYLPW